MQGQGHINTSVALHQSPSEVLPISRTRKMFLVFNRASNFLSSRRRSIIPRLLSRKKSAKWSKFKLSHRYNSYSFYNPRFHREYEFSPLSTPLIRFNGKRKNLRGKGCGHLTPLLSMWSCLRRIKVAETEEAAEKYAKKYHYDTITSHHGQPVVEDDGEGNLLDNVYSFAQEDSVDLRAEMFIRRFYEEMKMQIQE